MSEGLESLITIGEFTGRQQDEETLLSQQSMRKNSNCSGFDSSVQNNSGKIFNYQSQQQIQKNQYKDAPYSRSQLDFHHQLQINQFDPLATQQDETVQQNFAILPDGPPETTDMILCQNKPEQLF